MENRQSSRNSRASRRRRRSLAPFTRGGPTRWPERLPARAVIGRDDGPFAVDVLPVPESNPWLCQLRLSGFDFLAEGRRAAVCTWDGDVWLVEGVDRPEKGLTWRRIASGLFQPLGLKVVGDAIYVCCRDQIVRLHDLNGDGETDFYENFNNDHQVTEHFHEFAMDLQTDAEGNFYYAKAARHGLPALVPHHGTLLKVSKDGSRTEILATGFRAPNGVCLNPDGTFFLSDQEGFWTPKNRINWVKRGGFYGNMWGYTDVTDASDSAMEQPVCWLTNAFDRSPAQLLWVDTEQPGLEAARRLVALPLLRLWKDLRRAARDCPGPDAGRRVRPADPPVSDGRHAGPVPSRQRTALHLRPLRLGRRPYLMLSAMFIWLASAMTASAGEPALTLDVWPDKAPGESGSIGPEKVVDQKPGDKPMKLLTNVTHPTLSVFRPARDKDTGVAVVICPGGGYNILAFDLEGEEVAAWLNSIGVTGIVLKYRVPRREGTPAIGRRSRP